MVLVAISCGLAGAFGAIVFRLMIRLFQGLFFGGLEGVAAVYEKGLLAEAGDPLAVAQTLSWPVLLLVPALGGLIVGPLVYFFAREARGHGVPEVMEAVAVRGWGHAPPRRRRQDPGLGDLHRLGRIGGPGRSHRADRVRPGLGDRADAAGAGAAAAHHRRVRRRSGDRGDLQRTHRRGALRRGDRSSATSP